MRNAKCISRDVRSVSMVDIPVCLRGPELDDKEQPHYGHLAETVTAQPL